MGRPSNKVVPSVGYYYQLRKTRLNNAHSSQLSDPDGPTFQVSSVKALGRSGRSQLGVVPYYDSDLFVPSETPRNGYGYVPWHMLGGVQG